MQQPIIGYHQDEETQWVAELACGHNQHVRHNPPWEVRDWTQTQEGRDLRLGLYLNCKHCDDEAEANKPIERCESA